MVARKVNFQLSTKPVEKDVDKYDENGEISRIIGG